MKKKIILITSIVTTSLLVIITIFGIVDYNRALNGKRPIFVYRTVDVVNIDVAKEIENILSNKEGAIYYGIGYNVSICDNETGNYIFQLGHKLKESCYTSLTCTEDEKGLLTLVDDEVVYVENDKHTYEFNFFDDKLYSITATYLVLISSIENEETWVEETLDYFNVPGVDASIKKINDTTYEMVQTCNILNMSSEDVQNVCLLDYFDRDEVKISKLTKADIINQYHKDSCK